MHSMEKATTKHAVVTGANKGIGFEIVRQLASKGVTVALTARDEKRGLSAVEKLRDSGYDNVIFHLLDVTDPASVDSLVHFISSQFGKLDILVNNAGIGGVNVEGDNFVGIVEGCLPDNWYKMVTQTYELAEKCIQTNYYGTKRMCEALIPLLQLSDSPRIVNISSSMGKLKNIANEWTKRALSDAENLTEGRVDEVLKEYLHDFTPETPDAAYVVSKAATNAYTRILAKKFPNICINSICPGYVKTDLNYNSGILTVEEGAENPVWLALLPKGGPSGVFFSLKEETSLD